VGIRTQCGQCMRSPEVPSNTFSCNPLSILGSWGLPDCHHGGVWRAAPHTDASGHVLAHVCWNKHSSRVEATECCCCPPSLR
jgi:hypothetical protein